MGEKNPTNFTFRSVKKYKMALLKEHQMQQKEDEAWIN